MVRAGAYDADLDAVLGIPPSEGVDDVNLLSGVEVILGAFAIDLKGVFPDGHIDVAPPNVIFGGGVFGNALVAWRPAGFLTGVGNERTESRKAGGGLVANGVHVEPRSGRIMGDVFGFDAEVGKIDDFHGFNLT